MFHLMRRASPRREGHPLQALSKVQNQSAPHNRKLQPRLVCEQERELCGSFIRKAEHAAGRSEEKT